MYLSPLHLLTALFACSTALAQTAADPRPDPRFDPTTGQSTQVWRKPMPIDYTHATIEIDIPDVTIPVLTGLTTLRGDVTGLPISRIVLDASGPQPLEPLAASVNGLPVTWKTAAGKLTLNLSDMLPPRSPVVIAIKYNLAYDKNEGEGLTFKAGDPEAELESRRSPFIHAQGQAELNSRWFPLFDSPADRITSEVITTVDSGYQVLSNGRLLSTTPATPGSTQQPRTRWHWALDNEHAPYLVTLAIGKFAIVELGGDSTARPGISMPLYAPQGLEDQAAAMYAKTPDIMAFLENYFDEPYPWPLYAQALTPGFVWGGMENTGATLLTMRSLRGEPGAADELIVHEMAHQWMGNLVTCRHWDHLWLNEGWATFMESLWVQHTQGEDAYRASVADTLRSMITRDALTAPQTPAIVSKRYSNPDDTFEKKDNPYGKGSLVLHMLREQLGREAFDNAAREYLKANRNRAVETDDFRFALEAATGQSLERFFEQWLLRPGIPRLQLEQSFDASSNLLTLKATQTQLIDRFNPAYALSIPVIATFADGSTRTLTINTTTREFSQVIALSQRPTTLQVDPNLTLMASLRPRRFDLITGGTSLGEVEVEEPTETLAPTN